MRKLRRFVNMDSRFQRIIAIGQVLACREVAMTS
jgi:hypothetical protein